MKYNYPAIYPLPATMGIQVEKIREEFLEFIEVVDTHSPDISRIYEELADVHHAIETFWRALDEAFPGHADKIRQYVIKKNSDRGYYDRIP